MPSTGACCPLADDYRRTTLLRLFFEAQPLRDKATSWFLRIARPTAMTACSRSWPTRPCR
ncbi:MAG: hypothetical protein H6906_03435 [Hyphomicrobiales bacterium]|nr:hypothetical protein [Hyphomicrobiales bacterium]